MYLGVDIGGTKTFVAVLDEHGTIKEQLRFRTPVEYHNFLHVLKENLSELSTQDFKAAGVGVPGRLNRDAGVAIAFGNRKWRDVPIEADIKQIVKCPVVIENDSRLAGLSEAALLKDQYHKVLYVTISTGIGVGVIVDGKIEQALADSEAGSMQIQHNGKPQRWETFASGKAIVKRFGKKAQDIHDAKTWQIIAHDLAEGLINLIAIVQPDVIVFGGGVGQYLPRFEKFLRSELKVYENPMLTSPPMREAARPEEAVIYGCYELAKASHG